MARAGAGRIGNYHSASFRSEGVGVFQPESWADPTIGDVDRLNREAEVRLEMVAPRSAEAAVVAALVEMHPYEEPAYDVYERRGNDGMIGRVGRPPGGTSVRSFAQLVAARLGGDVRLSWATADLNLVAVVPGAGADFIDAAVATGAKALVTGDVSHHQARRAIDLGLSIIDPGHARTERPGVAGLYNLIADAVSGCRRLDRYRSEPVGGSTLTDKAFLDLLGLQAIDTEIDQLLHARQSLPELDQFKDAHEAITVLQATADTAGGCPRRNGLAAEEGRGRAGTDREEARF